MKIYIHSQESSNKVHGTDTVGWVAFSQGEIITGKGFNFTAKILPASYDNRPSSGLNEWYNFTYGKTYSSTFKLLVVMQNLIGADTTGMRLRNISGSSFELTSNQRTKKLLMPVKLWVML